MEYDEVPILFLGVLGVFSIALNEGILEYAGIMILFSSALIYGKTQTAKGYKTVLQIYKSQFRRELMENEKKWMKRLKREKEAPRRKGK